MPYSTATDDQTQFLWNSDWLTQSIKNIIIYKEETNIIRFQRQNKTSQCLSLKLKDISSTTVSSATLSQIQKRKGTKEKMF